MNTRKLKAILLILATVAMLFTTVHASDIEYDGYIVKLSDSYSFFDMLSAKETDIEPVDYMDGFYVVGDKSTVDMLALDGAIEYAEPNYIFELLGDIPNDPYYSYQWTLDMINYSELYKSGYSGSGVTVAVIDSGADLSHSDFNGIKISKLSKNFLGDGTHADAYMRDQQGHGTFVTSQIAAVTDNGIGIASIASGAEIMILRVAAGKNSDKFVYDAAYDSKSLTLSTICSAIRYAADNGADVINISIGSATNSTALSGEIKYATDKGIIVTSAAGNKGTTVPYYPASCENVIGVGSVSSDGTRSSFSQYNTSVDAVAPGNSVVGISPYPNEDGKWYTSADDAYCYGSGTSYSSPVVAALAVIAKQINPALDSEDFLSVLAITSKDAGDGGYDVKYGYGIVDAKEILSALTEREYAINYFLCDSNGFGARMPDEYADSYKLSKNGATVLPIPTRKGYKFEGWCRLADLSDNAITSLDCGTLGALAKTNTDGVVSYSIEPIDLYAKWSPSGCLYADEAEYDLFVGGDMAIDMIIPENNLRTVRFDGLELADECSLNGSTLVIKEEFLGGFPVGKYTLEFVFEKGSATLALNIVDSTPEYTVTAITEGEICDRFSSAAIYDVKVYANVASISVDFSAENAFVYLIYGDFMKLLDSNTADGMVTYTVFSDGVYAVSDKPLVLYGDANSDGDITIIDTVRILKRVADNTTNLDVAASDCNMDLCLSVLDVLSSLHILLN